eukprot:188883-Amorphochlora_amoeboformis.AAC.1
MKLTNIAFAVSFLAVRGLLYGRGLFHLLFNVEIIMAQPHVPPSVAFGLVSVIVAGFLLNIFWMRRIFQIALGTRKSKSVRKA